MATGESKSSREETGETVGPFISTGFEMPNGMRVAYFDDVSTSWDEAEARIIAHYKDAEPIVEAAKSVADKLGQSAVDILRRAYDLAKHEQAQENTET